VDDESISVEELDTSYFFYQTHSKARRARKSGFVRIHGNQRFTPEQEEEMVVLILSLIHAQIPPTLRFFGS
jgi:hypothetical protein